MNRRDFHKLSLAAFSGAVSGTLAGCGETPKPEAPKTGTGKTDAGKGDAAVAELHVCRGLNACKGKGAGATNECAGQGACASKETVHTCAQSNKCKGQGGCGNNPGENACETKGGCSVPLMDHAWKKVRAKFEEKMKKADKKFGEAPAKA